MDIRYSANQKDFKRYTTEETRDEFLIENLYVANEVVAVYSHVDRMVTLGCMPTTETVSIDKGIDIWKNFGTSFSLKDVKSVSSTSADQERSKQMEKNSAWAIKTAYTSQREPKKYYSPVMMHQTQLNFIW